MSTALIGIGSNLGDRRENVRRALELLAETPGVEVVKSSRLYGSKPIGGPQGQNDFVNAAGVLQTSLMPHALLKVLQQVETQLGRSRSQRWAPRTIDLDLLLFDQEIIEDDDLTLPHPRMSFRRFVLQPAAEIAPEMVHPVISWRIDELLARLDHGPHYVAIGGGFRNFFHESTWVAKRLHYVLDCPLVPWRSQGLPIFSETSTFRPLTTIVEFFKLWAGALSYDRWKSIPELQSLLDASTSIREDGSQAPPAVSDFWFEEWRFQACLCRRHEGGKLPVTHEVQQWLEDLEKLSQVIVSPKLVLWLDTNSAHSTDVQGRWSSCRAEAIRQAPCGPLLRLDTDDREWMLSESIAAIKAMQPLEGHVS